MSEEYKTAKHQMRLTVNGLSYIFRRVPDCVIFRAGRYQVYRGHSQTVSLNNVTDDVSSSRYRDVWAAIL